MTLRRFSWSLAILSNDVMVKYSTESQLSADMIKSPELLIELM